MNWVDVLVVVVALGAALYGWRTGAVVQLLTFGGVWLGLVIGALIAPPVASLASGTARSVLALVALLVAAALFGTAASVGAGMLRRVLRRVHLGPADGAIGAIVGVAAALLASWLVGSLLSSTRYPSVSRAVQGSAIIRGLGDVLPSMPSLFAQIESFLSANGFPVVFVNLPPGLIAPAGLPPPEQVQAAVDAAGPSTVRISGEACGSILSGSGFVVAPGLVATNAHVVAGEARTDVFDGAGAHAATPIWFDPALDLAVLRVADLRDPPLAMFDGTVERGTVGAVLGYPGGGAFASSPAAVTATFRAVGLDIYGTATVTREVYELNATVLPGDSGGPLVAAGATDAGTAVPAGTVVGVVFSRSAVDPHVGYALTTTAVEADVRQAESAGTPVSTGACTP